MLRKHPALSCSYVMQDDLLNAHHSVEETLLYAAKVCSSVQLCAVVCSCVRLRAAVCSQQSAPSCVQHVRLGRATPGSLVGVWRVLAQCPV